MNNVLKEKQDVIIGVILALIVGLLLGFGAGRQTSGMGGETAMSDNTPATTTKNSAGTTLYGAQKVPVTGVVSEGNSVSALDQSAGKKILLKSVMLSQEAWVAIRDSSGKTLGAGLFSAGVHYDVSVSLLRATEAGQNYQALIYFDDGSKTFNLKTETIVLNPDGSVAGSTFNVK